MKKQTKKKTLDKLDGDIKVLFGYVMLNGAKNVVESKGVFLTPEDAFKDFDERYKEEYPTIQFLGYRLHETNILVG